MKKHWIRKNKKLMKRDLPAPLVLAVIGLIIFALARANLNILDKRNLAQTVKFETQNQLDDLESQRKQLQRDIDQLSSNEGIEEKIREKFRVVKNGEQLVVITGDKSATTKTKTANPVSTEENRELQEFFDQ